MIPTLDEVSFVLRIEDGEEKTAICAPRTAQALTEYVIQTGEPLLISRDVSDRVSALGGSSCWVGMRRAGLACLLPRVKRCSV